MVKFSKVFLTLLMSLLFVFGSISTLNALPQGMILVNGRAVFSEPEPGALKITQETKQLSIEFSEFSIQNGESMEVIHVVPEAITNIRVTGPQKTSISGKVRSRGNVNVSNSKGFVFYPGANFKVKKLTFDVR